MKRKKFIAALSTLIVTPIAFLNGKEPLKIGTGDGDFTIIEGKQTIYQILKEAFGKEDQQLFKKFITLFPKEYHNLPMASDPIFKIKKALAILSYSGSIYENYYLCSDAMFYLNYGKKDFDKYQLIKSLDKRYSKL